MTGRTEARTVKGKRGLPKQGSSEESEESLPTLTDEEKSCINAKLHLLTQSSEDGISLYDHLSVLLSEVLENRPENPADMFEKLSLRMKRDRLTVSQSTVRASRTPSPSYNLALVEMKQFETVSYDEIERLHDSGMDTPEKEERFSGIPNIMRQAHYFQMGGVGLSMEEYARIALSLRDLVKTWPIFTVRFWGKILGLKQNYYVAEAEFLEGEYETDISDDEDDDDPAEEKEDSIFDETTTILSMKPIFKHPPKIPCEGAGTGLNRKVYFVCSEPCQPWYRLPHVTPPQVVAARSIRKYFTGFLNNPVVTHPPFPGQEKNYLRAQIARISGSTHVSPIGYYKFEEEGEEEEEGETQAEKGAGPRDSFVEDSDFEGLQMRDLTDPGVTAWVHHSHFILKQGRTTWYNPNQGHEGDEAEEEEEERNEPDEPEPEQGVALLTPISDDADIESKGQKEKSPAWIAKASSQFVPEYAVAILHSNTWPGAYAFATVKGRYFENVYIGWGQKNLGCDHEPVLPDAPLTEFPSGEEVTEKDDPKPETEAAIRAANREKEIERKENDDDVGDLDDADDDDDDEGDDELEED